MGKIKAGWNIIKPEEGNKIPIRITENDKETNSQREIANLYMDFIEAKLSKITTDMPKMTFKAMHIFRK